MREKPRRRLVIDTFAVPVSALRLVDPVYPGLRPGEILVRGEHPRVLGTVPTPSPLAFRAWRLHEVEKLTFGQVANLPEMRGQLAKRSKSSTPERVRLAEVKRFVKRVRLFLKTPDGLVLQQTSAWSDWLRHGNVDPLREADRILLQEARRNLTKRHTG